MDEYLSEIPAYDFHGHQISAIVPNHSPAAGNQAGIEIPIWMFYLNGTGEVGPAAGPNDEEHEVKGALETWAAGKLGLEP